jgi:putative aldouronate transport system substrate-binding protein
MKKLTFRRIAAALLMSMMIIVNVGCTSENNKEETAASTTTGAVSESSAAAASEQPKEEAVDPLGKYSEPITVTMVFCNMTSTDVYLKGAPGESIEKNVWTDYYKEKLNIDLKYNFIVDSSQYETKVNIAIASGDMPDFLRVSPIQAQQLAEAGTILPVEDVMKYASEPMKEIYSIDNGYSTTTFTMNDKLMAIPTILDPVSSAPMAWIRKDWLDKLGLSVPQTKEELIDVMTKFARNDPDGNGKNDTVGLALNKLMFSGVANLKAFFNMSGAYTDMWIDDGTGKLTNGLIQPQVKEALAELQKLYKDGVIDKEFTTKADQQIKEDISSQRIGFMLGEHFYGGRCSLSRDSSPDAEWITVGIPGKISLPSASQNQNAWGFVVNKKAAHPEAIMKMINLNNATKNGDEATYKKYQTTEDNRAAWRVAPLEMEFYAAPEKNLFIQSGIAEAIKTGDVEAAFSKISNRVSRQEFNAEYNTCLSYEKDTTAKNLYGNYLIFGPSGSERILSEYKEKDSLLYDLYTGPKTATMVEKSAILDKLRDEMAVRIIMGEESIDGFDKFIENWKSLGGEQITNEVNEWYQANK